MSTARFITLLAVAVVIIGGIAWSNFYHSDLKWRDQQMTRAFEQLASDKPPVRLAAIYTLENVMNSSVAYHAPVLEALSSFIRQTRPQHAGIDANVEAETAFRVIARRQMPRPIYCPFPACENREEPRIDLSGSYLEGARLDWEMNVLPEPTARAANADSFIEYSIRESELRQANFSKADLARSDLGEAVLIGADFTAATLAEANLTSVGGWLVNFSGANLSRVNFAHSDLRSANFTRANLASANLDRANLDGAKLLDALNLTQSQIDKACGDNKYTRLPPGFKIRPCGPYDDRHKLPPPDEPDTK